MALRSGLGTLGIFVILFLIIEVYTYFGLRPIFQTLQTRRIFTLAYLAQSILVIYALSQMYGGLTKGAVFRSTQYNLMIGIVFTSFVTKLLFSAPILLQDIGRFIGYLFNVVQSLFSESATLSQAHYPSRRRFYSLLTAGLATIPLFSMLYGITRGKYNYKVTETPLVFDDLPSAFDGFRIVQISDIHAGSIDSQDEVLRGVQMVNDLNPDLICFTGDLVNQDKDEINPFIDIFSQLEATHGKYAVLGNHDYYGVPKQNPTARTAYWQDFYQKFETMGFKLLNNASDKINKEGSTITLSGVENWGAGPWFPKRGDLDQTFTSVRDDDFVVLMSHDPTHWEEKVKAHRKHVHLTLSGHTHGMQFGFKMAGYQWSPAQYRYPHWSGLYEGLGQYLYVNRGFGFLGFPGRVGMWPEITVIELKSA